MSVKAKRVLFLAIIVCACVVNMFWHHESAVQASMLMVLCPTFLYWILRLLVPSFRERNEVSMYVGKLKGGEKAEAGITAVCMVALLISWSMKLF